MSHKFKELSKTERIRRINRFKWQWGVKKANLNQFIVTVPPARRDSFLAFDNNEANELEPEVVIEHQGEYYDGVGQENEI